jgi:hypothetical protein
MVITPEAGSPMTSTTTVSISRWGDFSRGCFFRTTFLGTGLGFALPIARLVLPRRADFAAFYALPRAVLLRNLARFFGGAFARFFRLAMISSQPLCTAVSSRVYALAAARSNIPIRIRPKRPGDLDVKWQSFVRY